VKAVLTALVATVLCLAGCGSGGDQASDDGPVRVLTHREFPLTEELIDQLEQLLDAPVAVVVEKDQASMVDLLTASSAPPAIDVVLGLDSLDVGTVLDAGLFAPYSPRSVDRLESTLRLGDDMVVPMRWTDVCFNFDKFWFEPPEPSFVGPRGPGRVAPIDGEPGDGTDQPDDGTGATGDGSSDTSVPSDDGTAGSVTGSEDSVPEAADGGEEGLGDDSGGDGGSAGEGSQGEGSEGDVNGIVPDPPASVDSLALEPYQGLATMADPARDRFSLAFLAGLASTLGVTAAAPPAPPTSSTGPDQGPQGPPQTVPAADPALVDALRSLRANGLAVTDGFQEAYFGEFTAGSVDGTRPLVLASALMPAVSVRFVDPLPEGVQTAVINDECARLVDYAGVLAVAPHPVLARRLLDLLIAPEFQFELFDTRGSQPARTDLINRPEVAEFGIAVQPVLLDPLTTASQVEGLLAAWEQAGIAAPADPTQDEPDGEDSTGVADDG